MKSSKKIIKRLRISILGAVQGVGFRPFIYRLANNLGINGWVGNSSSGVLIEAEGIDNKLQQFLIRIDKEKPQKSFIQSMESSFLDPKGFDSFEIKKSLKGKKTALIMSDIATCDDCKKEIFDSRNKRYLYPFTNCTNCGPRYSIIEKLPFDRPNTTMKEFNMCESCKNEYVDPSNRRFHAQPNACPECGPRLELWGSGHIISKKHDALEKTVDLIRKGNIIALKGLGGFQLIVDAQNDSAVKRLRERKVRLDKPFALMYPSMEKVKKHCHVSKLEERLLISSESPIVLLKKKSDCGLPDIIAPKNPYLGVMLPYTPLHILLMHYLDDPVIATSGNISEEPIIICEKEAFNALASIADYFLIHDRRIARHVDDSIVRIIMEREMILRRARGYAPLPIHFDGAQKCIMAVGGQLKNTVAFSSNKNVYISQHIGDLETDKANSSFEKTIDDIQSMYEFKPEVIACDYHPDYMSTKFAKSKNIPLVNVQHHYAHVLSCAAENEVKEPFLGVSWDGTGYGGDGTVWGGEFLKVFNNSFDRIGHFKGFPLPGGEVAVKEPRRSAIGLLYAIFGKDIFLREGVASLNAFSQKEKNNIKIMLEKGINSPITTSVGRIFDAVSSILDIRHVIQFEGQAAMELEFSLDEIKTDDVYSFSVEKCSCNKVAHNVVGSQLIKEILNDIKSGISKNLISAKFHNTLADIIVDFAVISNCERVVLSGGCFQNKYLMEKSVKSLKEKGFLPYWHQRVPPNDGGISLGQIVAAMKIEKSHKGTKTQSGRKD